MNLGLLIRQLIEEKLGPCRYDSIPAIENVWTVPADKTIPATNILVCYPITEDNKQYTVRLPVECLRLFDIVNRAIDTAIELGGVQYDR
jgi:hypothetical protein